MKLIHIPSAVMQLKIYGGDAVCNDAVFSIVQLTHETRKLHAHHQFYRSISSVLVLPHRLNTGTRCFAGQDLKDSMEAKQDHCSDINPQRVKTFLDIAVGADKV